MGVQTFWLEPTEYIAVGLRRYSTQDKVTGWTCASGYHSALIYIGTGLADYHSIEGRMSRQAPEGVDHDDSRWPTVCDKGCGYIFKPEDHWQTWSELIYRRTDNDQLRVLHQDAPAPNAPSAEPGACWNAWWIPESWKHEDGMYVMCRLPDGHDWAIDSQANNCTRPDRPHHCWVRHGDPRECRLTVDKNGETCEAGAGSIASPNWHGFLRDGQLVT